MLPCPAHKPHGLTQHGTRVSATTNRLNLLTAFMYSPQNKEHIINRLVFVTETQCVFCEVGKEFNRLKPNDPYMGRTAPLTSKRCILYIYSTNVSTEYFKHALYSPVFFSSKCSLFHNANLFGSCIIHILYTGCAKI